MSHAPRSDFNPYAPPEAKSEVALAGVRPPIEFVGYAAFWRRFAAGLVDGVVTGLMIGLITAAFTEKRQALHDMIAGTLVMKVR